jgi:hypothetical protein
LLFEDHSVLKKLTTYLHRPRLCASRQQSESHLAISISATNDNERPVSVVE